MEDQAAQAAQADITEDLMVDTEVVPTELVVEQVVEQAEAQAEELVEVQEEERAGALVEVVVAEEDGGLGEEQGVVQVVLHLPAQVGVVEAEAELELGVEGKRTLFGYLLQTFGAKG